MILEIFKYFSRFPAPTAIKAMATLGQSPLPEYATLLSSSASAPVPEDSSSGPQSHSTPLLPELTSYLYAQSVDDLQKLLQKLTGSFLLVDYGEITFSQRPPRSIEATLQIAVTIATKVSERADALERLIINSRALTSLFRLYSVLIHDSDTGELPWLCRDQLLSAQFVPFVSPELSAIGWTLMFEAPSTDPLSSLNPSE